MPIKLNLPGAGLRDFDHDARRSYSLVKKTNRMGVAIHANHRRACRSRDEFECERRLLCKGRLHIPDLSPLVTLIADENLRVVKYSLSPLSWQFGSQIKMSVEEVRTQTP